MRKALFWVLLLGLVWMTGCNSQVDDTPTTATEINPNRLTLYYIDEENMELCEHIYYCTDVEKESQAIKEISDQLFTKTKQNEDMTLPLPTFMTFKEYEMESDRTLSIYMDIAYQDNMKGLETLCKAAIVKSFCQLDCVDKVTFFLNDLAFVDSETVITETYDEEDFVVASGSDSYVQQGEIRIYFANAKGTALKTYDKSVEITNNVSLEQLVVEALLKGPLRDGYQATIPSGTVLNKISIKDGTAYVDFSEQFNGVAGEITSELTIYSVVNSLVELPTISRVQILIGGKKTEMYRETVDISKTLERNLDLIEPEK